MRKNRKGLLDFTDGFIMIRDIPAPTAMTLVTSWMNVFGTDPAPREKQGERTKKKESMPSHVFADWYHIMITVLKIVPTRQTFHHERLRNR